jgi:hypothetical protein
MAARGALGEKGGFSSMPGGVNDWPSEGWRMAAFTLPILTFNGLISSDSSDGGIVAVAPLNR